MLLAISLVGLVYSTINPDFGGTSGRFEGAFSKKSRQNKGTRILMKSQVTYMIRRANFDRAVSEHCDLLFEGAKNSKHKALIRERLIAFCKAINHWRISDQMSMNLALETQEGIMIDFPFQTPTDLTMEVLALETKEEQTELVVDYIATSSWPTSIKKQLVEEIESLMKVPTLKLRMI